MEDVEIMQDAPEGEVSGNSPEESNISDNSGNDRRGTVSTKEIIRAVENEGKKAQVPSGKPSDSDSKATSERKADNSSEMHEVKVNGKIVKMNLQELIANASMAHAAQEKFNEGAKARKEMAALKDRFSKTPIEALLDPEFKLTKDQLREKIEAFYNREFIEPEQLTPDQRKVKEYEEKLKRYEDQELESKKKQEQEQEEAITNKEREFLQSQIIEAMEKSGLPKSKELVKRMAFYMRQNLQNGWEAPIDMIINQVKRERQEMMSDLTENSSVEQLISLLGEGVINKIRKFDLDRLRARRNIPNPSFNNEDSKDENKKISYYEAMKNIRNMK
jgi:hypothetical protein